MKNNVITILGTALTPFGAGILLTVLYSNFSRYMAVEDLGLDTSDPEMFRKLVAISFADKIALTVGIGLLILGIALLIFGLIRGRNRVSKPQ